jgi:3-aminobutyryl-CoA ammonia-lyase
MGRENSHAGRAVTIGKARPNLPDEPQPQPRGFPMPEPDLSRYVATIETRVDSHYANQVVSLGIIAELLGMAGTKLAYMLDGDGGYMAKFESLEFMAPVYQGDFVRVTARLTGIGNSSRRRAYEAHVTARCHGVGASPSHGALLDPPLLVARATGITVTPVADQRLTPPALKGKPK